LIFFGVYITFLENHAASQCFTQLFVKTLTGLILTTSCLDVLFLCHLIIIRKSMCGIVCVFDLKTDAAAIRPQILDMSKKVRHRGPDWSGMYATDRVLMAHERLAIVDPVSGGQPLYNEDKSLVLAVNGEIYNHMDLRKQLQKPYAFQTQSDCEIILALYEEKGTQFLEDLNGIFAFALYDNNRNSWMIGRDHIGIIPLFLCKFRTKSPRRCLQSY
jgi:asparagine synthase (glutamine-hydrolysing)